MRIILVFILLWGNTAFTQYADKAPLKAVTLDTVLMGSAFLFTAVHENSDSAWIAVHKGLNEVVRIENLISSWNPDSETSEINRMAGVAPVKVSSELRNLVERSLKVSVISDGYFDISFASAEKYWTFDGRSIDRPAEEEVNATVKQVGFQNIICDEEAGTVFLKNEGMRIGFGAIGKGYAANRATAVMKASGIHSGVVNAGGDLMAWGSNQHGGPWSIGISDPADRSNVIAWLDASDQAVVTSGNYLKFVEIDRIRYGHIIDPKTGWPARGLTSVTVICPDAELADALATTVFVLGPEAGLKLVNQMNGIEALLVTENGDLLYSEGVDSKMIGAQEIAK